MLLLLLQLCNALVHLQRHHVVHRDMKVCMCGWHSLELRSSVLALWRLRHLQMDNVFIGKLGWLKLADFGQVLYQFAAPAC